jgi:hypothetical protein
MEETFKLIFLVAMHAYLSYTLPMLNQIAKTKGDEMHVNILGTLVVLLLNNHWMEKISVFDVMKSKKCPY